MSFANQADSVLIWRESNAKTEQIMQAHQSAAEEAISNAMRVRPKVE